MPVVSLPFSPQVLNPVQRLSANSKSILPFSFGKFSSDPAYRATARSQAWMPGGLLPARQEGGKNGQHCHRIVRFRRPFVLNYQNPYNDVEYFISASFRSIFQNSIFKKNCGTYISCQFLYIPTRNRQWHPPFLQQQTSKHSCRRLTFR